MKIVVAPDKFKGSLPATQVAAAVVELACVCGLARLPGGPGSSRAAPLTASSFGAGEVLRAALEAGAHRIILGVGGSASTDGGAGLLEALGARVLDARSEPAGPAPRRPGCSARPAR
jgi:glycerate 2-kinase